MQVIHNTILSEYYCVDKDRKFTIQLVNKQWTCNCYQPDCKHVKEVQAYLKDSRRGRP
ncbi:MAG: hypothetical protein PHS86_08745 [Syntrophaceae bacterium]|nr:hypothetical protein [Syntrophaceae bacterium]